jgi:CheY-like chemotaxis protein
VEGDRQERANDAGLRVLVAEDNVLNLDLAVRLFERRGHTVTVARNGAEALEILARETFDLVCMDVQMPVMDGLTATAELRAREAGTGGHVPVIAMTAHAMKGDRERCLEAGMDEYVAKPIDTDELFAVVETVVARQAGRSSAEGEDRTAPDEVLDRDDLMARLDGCHELVGELVDLFRSESHRVMHEIRRAIDERDPEQLMRTAHCLKGAVANLSSRTAFDAALRMEQIGRASEFELAEDARRALEHEIDRLQAALASLTDEKR